MTSIPPGSGWPDDPATTSTPIATTANDVISLAASAADLGELDARVSVCRSCPRLVAWREDVALVKRRAFADEPYWGRPIAGWGASDPTIALVGLAPAAHGGNRTGRIFTGDRSGDWLFAALHRAGLAAQPTSVRAGDGQRLIGVRMMAAVRCAPPANKPTVEERDTCRPWLDREFQLVAPTLRVIVALGGFGWTAVLATLASSGVVLPRPIPRFGHGVAVPLGAFPPFVARPAVLPAAAARIEAVVSPRVAASGAAAPFAGADPRSVTLLGCYHPSQQNTFTGRLTEAMLDDVLSKAKQLAGDP